MMQQYEVDKDPISEINLSYTVLWLSTAWYQDVASLTIYNCFKKSSIRQPATSTLVMPPEPDVSTLYEAVRRSGGIRDAVQLQQFLNPPEESTIPQDSEIDGDPLEQALAYHLNPPVEEPLEEDESIEQDIPSNKEALQAIETLLQFRIRQEDIDQTEVRVLQRIQRSLRATVVPTRQTSLESYFYERVTT